MTLLLLQSGPGVAGAGGVGPVNTVLPVISGTAAVGSTLTTTNGTWTGTPTPTYTYQWKRAGTNISGATASTYLLVTADSATTITVTVTATNTAGSASATSAGVSIAASDPNWTSVKLLMGFEGSNGSTSGAGFTDESSAAHSTATISSCTISNAQAKFGATSLLGNPFGSNGVTFASHADWNLTTVPFTIEFWVYPINVGGVHAFAGRWQGSGSQGWLIWRNAAVIQFSVSTTGSDSPVAMSGGTLTTSTWQAICADFDGTKYRLYLNGTMVGSSTTLRTIFSPSAVFSIGDAAGGLMPGSAYIDELRFTNGVARYASDSGYTVATSAFPRS